jgi:uncharacterized protein YbjQ (UPF0145 family)
VVETIPGLVHQQYGINLIPLSQLLNLAMASKPSLKSEPKLKEVDDNIPSCFTDTQGIITSTMNDLPGYHVVKVLGTVYGITVRSRNWGANLGAFLRSSVGGEIRYFTNLMYTSRNSAVERLVGECMQRGGNAILALRFDQGDVG